MTTDEAYRQCLNEMFSLRRFGIKLGLDTIRQILADLGNPQETINTIHVAGTNGKGSVAVTLASILRSCGYKTGLYTSPHLIRFNERIVVDGRPIRDEDVLSAYTDVKAVHRGNREPTFFEFTTAMAFCEFKRRNVAWAVIETGMGGRLDATNIVVPVLSIITNISLEHGEYLGNTIREIAFEKAGIIKSGVPVVTGVKQKNAIAVIEAAASAQLSELYRMGKDFGLTPTSNDTFFYRGPHCEWSGLKPSLTGNHQLDNTALALAGIDVLSPQIDRLTQDRIKEALLAVHWPGRLETVVDKPLTLLDGAHNLAAARTLAVYLNSNLAERRITLVVGILDDKPYPEMLEALVPICRRVIVTQPKIQRALPTKVLEAAVKKMTQNVEVVSDVAQAVSRAIESSAPDDVVCIAGSLYVVGEAKAAIDGQTSPELL